MIIRDLGVVDYQLTLEKMRDFTLSRQPDTEDELWLLEHPPVFTQGANGDAAHLLSLHDIPLVQTDRGGQVTYHGPEQLIAYPLIDLKRAGVTVRQMVTRLEQTIIMLLQSYHISAHARSDAPGVYIDDSKIASLGLRVKRGGCYHGISFNINMSLTPFSYINPCGQVGMQMINLSSLGVELSMAEVKQQFVSVFEQQMQ